MTKNNNRRSCLKALATASVWTQPTIQSVLTPAHAQMSCTIVAPNNCMALQGRGDIPNLDPIFFEFYITATLLPDECRLEYSFVDFDVIMINDNTTLDINNAFSVRHELRDQTASIEESYDFSGRIITLSNGELQIEGLMTYVNNIAGRSNTENVLISLTCV